MIFTGLEKLSWEEALFGGDILFSLSGFLWFRWWKKSVSVPLIFEQR